jgi:hypothetical protein
MLAEKRLSRRRCAGRLIGVIVLFGQLEKADDLRRERFDCLSSLFFLLAGFVSLSFRERTLLV